MVVKDQFDHRNVASCRSRDLIHIHTKATISCNIDYNFVRICSLCSDRSTESVSHRAKSAGCQKSTWVFVFIILRSPHLMLSYFCCNDCFAICDLIEFLNDIWSGQYIMIVIKWHFNFALSYFLHPVSMRKRIQSLI